MGLRINTTLLGDVFREGATAPGLLIALAGFDASGKTTQIEALGQALRLGGREVIETRQPSDWYRNERAVQQFHDEGGSAQRARILALFAAADRLRHVHEVIDPALKRGAVVICDRYVYATFSVFVHRGVDFEFLVRINGGIPKPDAAFFLDVPTQELGRRLAARDGKDLKFEERELDRIQSLTDLYREMGDHLIRIDGCQRPDAVTRDLISHLPVALSSS